jgi:hypothetical protein
MLKKILFIVLMLMIVILLAGIYRFNFTNDDIYVQTGQGKVLPIDEVEISDIHTQKDKK